MAMVRISFDSAGIDDDTTSRAHELYDTVGVRNAIIMSGIGAVLVGISTYYTQFRHVFTHNTNVPVASGVEHPTAVPATTDEKLLAPAKVQK